MSTREQRFSINTTPTKAAIVIGLTKDASISACIFDLVDNSVDAASKTVIERNDKIDDTGLPSSYAGFEVNLTIDGKGVVIEDNCGGISVGVLRELVLRFGRDTPRPKLVGIGTFGVGLNRAIFKLGKQTRLTTDTGSERAELTLSVDAYLKSDDWTLPALSFPSSGSVGTKLEITNPTPEIGSSISDPIWQNDFVEELSKRYSGFLSKGLVLKVNGKTLQPLSVPIRSDGPYAPMLKNYKTQEGVRIVIEAGQHEKYRFPAEADYDFKANRRISQEFGWSIICNDRVIVMSDTTPKTGWDKQWHPEFNGFVGHVRFLSDDPAKLPWNTAKTDVDKTNPAYISALKDMGRFVERWRQNGYEAKKVRKGGGLLKSGSGGPQIQPLVPGNGNPLGSNPKTEPKVSPKIGKQKSSKPIRKLDHHSFKTILPQDINEIHCTDKLLILVHEAKRLDLSLLPYAGTAFMRILCEISATMFLKRRKKFDDLMAAYLKHREEENRPVPKKEEKNIWPNLEFLLNFLTNNPDAWGASHEPSLRRSLSKFVNKKSDLNDAVHHPYKLVNVHEALQMRDDFLPIMRHFIEN